MTNNNCKMAGTVLFYSSVRNKESFKRVQFYNIDINILNSLGYEVVLSNHIKDAWKFWQYDFVFVYFYRYSFFVAIIARLFGRRTVFTGGIDSLDQNNKGTMDYKIQKLFFRLCYIVGYKSIIVSQTDLINVKAVIADTRKLAYSEHVINVDTFHANVENKKNVFVTIGWMALSSVKRKGIDKAVRVFAALRRLPEFSESTLIIAGSSGDGLDFLKKLILELNIADSVEFKENISENDKIQLLEEARYYFQLSSYEGFGLAALEAVCAKCILIHSGKGGLSNPIYSEEVLFNIDNDMGGEVQTLYSNLLQYDTQCIERSYQKVRSNYNNDRRRDDFEQILG